MAEGDIRVLLVMDVVLSLLFSLMAVTAMSVAGISEFTWENVLLGAAFLAVVTYLAVLR